MLQAGTTTFEGKSGYGLDRETELASLRAIAAEGGIPTWLGAHAVPPEHEDADAYLDFALGEVLPRLPGSPKPPTSSSSVAPSRRAGAALPRSVRKRGASTSRAR